jgi:predicted permease
VQRRIARLKNTCSDDGIIRIRELETKLLEITEQRQTLQKAILPLSMISLGVQLSQAKIGWKNHDVWIVSSLKLFVLPLIGIALIYTANTFVPGFFTPVGAIVFLIYSAIPSAVNVALYSIEFNNNSDYATQVVMTTTTISAFSLTICIMIGHKLFV